MIILGKCDTRSRAEKLAVRAREEMKGFFSPFTAIKHHHLPLARLKMHVYWHL